MNPEIKRLSSIADKIGAKLLPVMNTQNLTKKDVYVVVDTPKKAKKLKKVLDMFGEKTYTNNTISEVLNSKECVHFYEKYNNKWCWSIPRALENKKEVSIKQLRTILGKEHLKEGDYVVCKTGDIVKITYVNEQNFDGIGNYVDYVCNYNSFKRYATPEEIALLEPKEVDKFAELKEAHKNGAVIQVKSLSGDWIIATTPSWLYDCEYRIKPEEKPKVGDVVKLNSTQVALVRNQQEAYRWRFCTKLTQQEVIDLLFGKEAFNA